MRELRLIAAALSFLAAFPAAPKALAAEPRRNTVGEKPFGLLLLGEGGDRDWKVVVDEARKRAGSGYPFAFAPGKADRRELQKGVDALQAQRARAVVVVPLFVSSYGEVMDQLRYLLGIREAPAKAFASSRRSRPSDLVRIKSRVPLVLTKALDDHPLFVELLASRAQALSRKPAEEALILVGESPAEAAEAAEWAQAAGALAEKVRQKGGFAAARAHGLRADGSPNERDAAAAGLAGLVRELRRAHGKVLVVPLAMSASSAKPLRLPRVLDGLFARYDGRTILPDARIPQWIEASALPAAKLPDMRLFKDAGKAGLTPQGLQHQTMTAPPALPNPGDKRQ